MKAQDPEVLKWVNQILTDQGRPTIAEMPIGYPKVAEQCSIARATGFPFDGHNLWPEDSFEMLNEEKKIEAPERVSRWAQEFDARKFPELIA